MTPSQSSSKGISLSQLKRSSGQENEAGPVSRLLRTAERIGLSQQTCRDSILWSFPSFALFHRTWALVTQLVQSTEAWEGGMDKAPMACSLFIQSHTH